VLARLPILVLENTPPYLSMTLSGFPSQACAAATSAAQASPVPPTLNMVVISRCEPTPAASLLYTLSELAGGATPSLQRFH
jgi:hypothetical protein